MGSKPQEITFKLILDKLKAGKNLRPSVLGGSFIEPSDLYAINLMNIGVVENGEYVNKAVMISIKRDKIRMDYWDGHAQRRMKIPDPMLAEGLVKLVTTKEITIPKMLKRLISEGLKFKEAN